MGGEFWKAATNATGGPLTPEMLQDTFDAMKRRMDEERREPRKCPHERAILHPAVARKIHGQPCPFCGKTLIYAGAIGRDE